MAPVGRDGLQINWGIILLDGLQASLASLRDTTSPTVISRKDAKARKDTKVRKTRSMFIALKGEFYVANTWSL